MNIKSIAIVASCALGIALTTGCRTNVGGGIMTSTKPVTQGQYVVVGDRVEASESSWMGPFGITTAKPGNPTLRCLDEALKKAPGADALIETGYNVEFVNYGIVKQFITRVIGTPVKTNK